MKPILILFATREGHTRLIAEYVASVLSERKIPARLICAKDVPPDLQLDDYSAALLAASVHVGKHEPELIRVVKQHRAELERLPTAFISVSLAEATVEDVDAPNERRLGAEENVQQTIESFCRESGWRPQRLEPVAGALLYTQYDVITRLVMRFIAGRMGRATDTSRDHDFTNWKALREFTEEFVDDLGRPPP
jgi:menaquinone-dependent protoporphyrinogen oxidase